MLKVIGASDLFDYYLNDPTTPTLVSRVPVPKLSDCPLKIEVIGFREGRIVQEDTVRVQAASVLFSVIFTLNWINKITPINSWAATDVLRITPRAGEQFNAYYNRYGLYFFYARHPVTKKIVFTCDSTEAVNHEFGHAILDALRPDFWDLEIFELFAFHEAFGDIISMLSSLHHISIIEHMLKETDGNLKKSNVVSRVAEEFGNALCMKDPFLNRPENCLRDASHHFFYKSPNSLPPAGPLDSLSKEAHSFSRVFSGAWYDIFTDIYRKKHKGDDVAAIVEARDVMAKLSLLCLPNIQKNENTFNAVAKAMIETDKLLFNGDHFDILRKVFSLRGILPVQTLY